MKTEINGWEKKISHAKEHINNACRNPIFKEMEYNSLLFKHRLYSVAYFQWVKCGKTNIWVTLS